MEVQVDHTTPKMTDAQVSDDGQAAPSLVIEGVKEHIVEL